MNKKKQWPEYSDVNGLQTLILNKTMSVGGKMPPHLWIERHGFPAECKDLPPYQKKAIMQSLMKAYNRGRKVKVMP